MWDKFLKINKMESKLPAYKQTGIPRIITIQGHESFYKDPPL